MVNNDHVESKMGMPENEINYICIFGQALRAESTSLALLRHQCTALEEAKNDHKI